MKKSDLFLLVISLLLVSYCFLSLRANIAVGQTDTSSSSSGDIASSSSSGEVVTSSSSSSGELVTGSSGCPQIQTDCAGEPAGCGLPFGIYDPSICMCVCPSSSSGSENTGLELNPAFTGVWKAKLQKGKPTSSSSGGAVTTRISFHLNEEDSRPASPVITFKLCVKDGNLEGTVQQGGAFINSMITSSTVISENEVEFIAEIKDDGSRKIKLILNNDREFAGTFEDGHTFTGRKLNPFKSCLAPSAEEGMTGPGMGEMGGPPPMGGMGDFGEPTEGEEGDFGTSSGEPQGMTGPGMGDLGTSSGGPQGMGGQPSDGMGLPPPGSSGGHQSPDGMEGSPSGPMGPV